MSHSVKKHPYCKDKAPTKWIKKKEHRRVRCITKNGTEIGNGNQDRKHNSLYTDSIDICYYQTWEEFYSKNGSRYHSVNEAKRAWKKRFQNK